MFAKKLAKERWADEWEASPTGRVLHQYQREPKKQTIHKYKGLKRAVAATLFQMRTGKIGLKDYLWHIQRADSPLCDCGKGRQTVRHVLLDCTSHTGLRKEIWSNRRSGWKGPNPPNNIKGIWENSQQANTAAIFMLRTGLLGRFTRTAVDVPSGTDKRQLQ
jgi:hypothetical protein